MYKVKSSPRSKSRIQKRYEYLNKSRIKPLALSRVAEKFFEGELRPVLEYISNEEQQDSIKISLRKNLIISCVSLIEDILSHLIMRVIDDNNVPIVSLVNAAKESEVNNRIMKFCKDNKIGTALSKGEYVALSRSFANPNTINTLFTALLT